VKKPSPLFMHRVTAFVIGILSCQAVSFGQLFSENFDLDPTANWIINNNNLGTTAANFFFDYSTVGIPPAPNSGGTTLGLKIGANLDPATAPASGLPGISVSPIGENFTGDYVLKFDWWSNYIGPLGTGATGSTMLSSFGIMSSGTSVNYPGVIDGVVFMATGDGQNSADYRAYSKERPASYDIIPPSTNPLDAHAVYPAGSRNSSAALYTATFPAGATAPGSQASLPTQTGSTPAGAAGFRWHEVSVSKSGSLVSWSVNDVLLATVDTSFFTTDGNNILFGMADVNSGTNASAAALDQLQFTLIDNIVVIHEPSCACLLGLAGVGLSMMRRRPVSG
jgi:hypothetical protein